MNHKDELVTETENALNEIHREACDLSWLDVNIMYDDRQKLVEIVKRVNRKLASIAELAQVALGD